MNRSITSIVTCLVLAIGISWPSVHAKGKNQIAPAFSLESLQGPSGGDLDKLRGRIIIIEFWATYCGWCKKTHPKLAKFAKAHPNVVVLGITAQNKSRVQRYLRRHNTGLTILHDPRGRVSRNYRAQVTPTLVVIDQNGIVQAWGQGADKLSAILNVASAL